MHRLVVRLHLLDLRGTGALFYAERLVQAGGIHVFTGGVRQVKAHRGLSYIVVDLAPQLYVIGQSLKAVFGDRVKDYSSLKCHEEKLRWRAGEVLLLGNWQIGRREKTHLLETVDQTRAA